MASNSRKILFLVPYPLGESPSQRFRFEQYFDILKNNGVGIEVQTFLNSHNWQIFFKSGNPVRKALALVGGFIKRAAVLYKASRFDLIFIHREATPIGPPVVEWVLAKVLKKKIVYDFDDAIWLTDRIQEPRLIRFLKWRSKVRAICKWSHKVSCGNTYLCEYAMQFNEHVTLNPTTVDTEKKHNPERYARHESSNQVVIGWTGSHSTLKYLKDIEAVLQKMKTNFPTLQFVIIADRRPDLSVKDIVFIPWSESTEIHNLMKIDIGLMPLPDDEWSKGKCGFKALQYMALGIPAVASAVGVNTSIIENMKNGMLCSTAKDWEIALTRLILDQELRERMGSKGRTRVIDFYSVRSNTPSFLSLFE